MNRYVSVPRHACTGESIPAEAETLARTFSLEIRVSDDLEDIEIISTPSVKYASCSDYYVPGRVWPLDVLDEFTDLSKKAVLMIDDVSYSPRIHELHLLKFRPRIADDSEVKKISVSVGGVVILEDTIKRADDAG